MADEDDWLKPREFNPGPVLDPAHFRLRAAPGSSIELVKETLGNGESGKGRRCSVLIIDFDVWVHHDAWHQVLRDAVGATNDQVRGEGNFSLYKGTAGAQWKGDTQFNVIAVGNKLLKDAFNV